MATNIVSVLMSQPVSRGFSALSCACCQGSAGAWCDACAEALAPLLFPCVSVLTLDGAACHGTCTTRREHAQFSQLVFKPQAGLKTAKMIAEKKKLCYFPALYSVFTIHLSQRSSSIWQYQTQTHSHKCLPLQQPRQHHLPQLPSSVVVPLVVETSSE